MENDDNDKENVMFTSKTNCVTKLLYIKGFSICFSLLSGHLRGSNS